MMTYHFTQVQCMCHAKDAGILALPILEMWTGISNVQPPVEHRQARDMWFMGFDELVDFYILTSLTPCIFSCIFLLIPSQRCRHQWSDWEWFFFEVPFERNQATNHRSINGKSSGHRMNLRTCSILSFKRMSRLLSDFWFNRLIGKCAYFWPEYHL